MILAVTVQQGIGVGLIATALTALLVYLVVENRVTKQSNVDSILNAPNRKAAPDDEIFEGPRLDRWLSWALVLMTITALSVPLYWLGEVGRQEGAIRGFDKRSVHRGEEAYFNKPNTKHGTPALNCASCHGASAGGGVAAASIKDYDVNGKPLQENGKDAVRSVSFAAPRLTDVALRYNREQLYNVLVYGRAPVMPAWGTAGGGPSTDQTIYDLINYLRHLALEKNEEAEKIYKEVWKETKDAEVAFNAALNSDAAKELRHAESVQQLADAKKVKANAGKSDGQILYEMNCARCHVAGYKWGEPNASGNAFGPKLTKEGLAAQFPDADSQFNFIKNGTGSENKPYGLNGINGYDGGGMPYFTNTLPDDQIRAIVAYERSLTAAGVPEGTKPAGDDTTVAAQAQEANQ
jgi:mono/diheme cytochrome c family protein